MGDTTLVAMVDRFGNHFYILSRGLDWQRSIPNGFRQRLTLDIFHAEVVLPFVFADFVNSHKARMVEMGRRGGLVLKSLNIRVGCELAGQDHLNRHDTIKAHLSSFVDDPHAATFNLFQQLVMSCVD